MEKVLCEAHGHLCFLKTGVRDGPNKGKSFYVCGVSGQQPCGFVLPTKLSPSHCLVHEEYVVDLQVLTQQQRKDVYRLFYRCSNAKLEGNQWCGSVPWQESKPTTLLSKPLSQYGPELLQNHTNQRNPFKLLNKNHEPLFRKQLNNHGDKSSVKKEKEETESVDEKDLQNISPSANQEELSTGIRNNNQMQKECEDLLKKGIEVPKSQATNEIETKASSHTHGFNSSKRFDGSEHRRQAATVISAGDNWKKEEKAHQSSPSFISVKAAKEEPLRKKALESHRDKIAPENINGSQGTEAKPLVAEELAMVQKLANLPKTDSCKKKLASLTEDNPEKSSTNTLSGIAPKEKNHVLKNVSSNNRDVLGFSETVDSSQKKDHSLKNLSSVAQEVAESVDSRALHDQLSAQLRQKKNTLKMVKLQALPDRGERLIKQVQELELALRSLNLEPEESLKEGEEVSNIKHQDMSAKAFSESLLQQSSSVTEKKPQLLQEHQAAKPLGPSLYCDDNYKEGGQMQAFYGGRMTEDRLQAVYDATCDAINQLHKSLESCPTEEIVAEDPPGLKVSLLLHQKQGLAWLLWRENQKPCGGILADDMGLGKTIAMIALVLAQKHLQEEKAKEEPLKIWKSRQDSTVIFSRGTLVVCPASLIHHWKKEVERHVRTRKLKITLYHGPNRIKNTTILSEYDIVITTYSILAKEIPVQKEANVAAENHSEQDKSLPFSPLLFIHWARIILDEAHNIKNPKVQASVAVCKLRATARWAVTGTPIQNNLLDMYSLLRFLRCSPFDEFKVWKSQVDNNTRKGGERLAILIRSLLLRRTKDQLDSFGKPLVSLPQRLTRLHRLKLSDSEQSVYDVLFARSRSTLQSYLKQQESQDTRSKTGDNPFDKGAQQFKSNQQKSLVKACKDAPPVSITIHILSLLLRLRQCCCHLSLLKKTLDQANLNSEGIFLSLEEQLSSLTLSEPDSSEPQTMVYLFGKAFNTDVFEDTKQSTKLSHLLEELKDIRGCSQKCVIVSQWTSMLKVVAVHLQKLGLKYATIDGSVNPKQRMDVVEEFNSNPKGPEVILVSLLAGGVGLNLVGGNHLFLLDMHWNPALEDQACDRIYRVGQRKDVTIHRFVCEETVEEKILELQSKKKELAQKVLSGREESFTKLTLADLKLLFGF